MSASINHEIMSDPGLEGQIVVKEVPNYLDKIKKKWFLIFFFYTFYQ